MRVYPKDPQTFLGWLETNGFRYAVLRGYRNMGEQPARGGKDDMDVLVDAAAAGALRADARGLLTCKSRGFKCDLDIGSGDTGAGGWNRYCLLPQPLAEAALANRVRWQGQFFVPADPDLYDALLYHIAYQKGEASGADAFDASGFRRYKRHAFVKALAERLGKPCDLSLMDMHRYLAAKGYALDRALACRYVQNQFAHGLKSVFFAHLFREGGRGEMNFFVLRAKAVRRGFRQAMLDELAKHYTILAVKDIPWLTRLARARQMRGNKWRWGGWPVTAVVVFDPSPLWRTADECAQLHPLVFNSRQFIKRDLRDRIVREGRLYHKDNALHSTDNEAEAVGHLPLFFSPEEEEAIHARVAALRIPLSREAARR
jgi:hypothetical protein